LTARPAEARVAILPVSASLRRRVLAVNHRPAGVKPDGGVRIRVLIVNTHYVPFRGMPSPSGRRKRAAAPTNHPVATSGWLE
jgi:hypothetical protein